MGNAEINTVRFYYNQFIGNSQDDQENKRRFTTMYILMLDTTDFNSQNVQVRTSEGEIISTYRGDLPTADANDTGVNPSDYSFVFTSIGQSITFEVFFRPSDFVITLWVYPSVGTANQTIFSLCSRADNSMLTSWHISPTNGELAAYVPNYSGRISNILNANFGSSINFTLNNWHFLALIKSTFRFKTTFFYILVNDTILSLIHI
eukprot:TRINITY_DN8487_c0_g1_i3.p1 TRINITY_DN8487_c0_g1~~TRINITY_DN8487_c0_g1_i3.p1  ORF type:complete len:205 (-),score=36.54 TRINITY_DN8487_c0_g1_i3:59-673(-)